MTPKPIVPPEQLSEETRELFDLLNHEADLAVILIATSFLDACLKSILENHFLEGNTSERMLGHSGILGALSARSDLCYVLGLISKGWYNDLRKFAEIRNTVAHHHLQLSFDDEDIAKQCNELSTIELIGMGPEQMTPRTRFTLCVAMLANWLLITALQIKQKLKVTSPRDPRLIRYTTSPPPE